MAQLAGRLARQAGRPLGLQTARLEGLATQARLVDPRRLLARGYTITLDEQGRAVTGAAALAAGDVIGTRFHDGQVRSIVQPGEGLEPRSGKRKGSTRKSHPRRKESGQDRLF